MKHPFETAVLFGMAAALASVCSVQTAPAAEPPATNTSPAMIQLPQPSQESKTSLESTLRQRRSVREFNRQPLTLAEVSQLLWAAQGMTSPDGKRTAPSAGALYPLEVFVVAGNVDGLPAGIYRYRSGGHQLARVAEGDKRAAISSAALEQDWMKDAPATIVIVAVPERTERKYGRRAERYVHIETGHAAQNVQLQAVALGLGSVVVGAFDDARVKELLALGGSEQPLCLMPVGQPHR
jgi:SagB-type dehydrogenase family enzyme